MSDGETPEFSSASQTPSTSRTDQSAEEANLGHGTSQSDSGEEIEFNLSDPTDLAQKMDNLTDEQLEELLSEALKVNKQLKTELNKNKSKGVQSASSKKLPPLRVPSTGSRHGGSQYNKTQSRKSKTAGSSTRPKNKPQWDERFGL